MADKGKRTGRAVLLGGAVFAVLLALFGLVFGDPETVLPGLRMIYTSQAVLISDYIELAGIAAACCNAALVTLFSVLVLWLSRTPVTGYALVILGQMSGFAFFGKNLVNILPILVGTFLYAQVRRESFADYAPVGLLATSLAPVVSFFALAPGWGHIVLGIAVGVVIGFLLPPLSDYTYRIQNGMNLYNMGFACGLLALVIVPVLSSLDRTPEKVLLWSTGHRAEIAWGLGGLCVFCILLGLAVGRFRGAMEGYWELVQSSGRAPSDYLTRFGVGPTLINMGVNGLLGMGYILLIKGDFSGPVIGALLTVMGFSGFGKHVRNMAPVMAGVMIGGVVMVQAPDAPSLQIAALFGTALAPISGHFGWPAGILAGFLHSAMVLQTGSPAEGLNLYNNGFSAGLLAIVLYAILTVLAKHRRPTAQNEDYFQAIVEHSGKGEDDVAEDMLTTVRTRLQRLSRRWAERKDQDRGRPPKDGGGEE